MRAGMSEEPGEEAPAEAAAALPLQEEESAAEDAQLREVFAVCDLDHNGAISLAELQLVIGESGTDMTTDQISDIFKQLDVDDNGEIDFPEFKKGYSKIFGGAGGGDDDDDGNGGEERGGEDDQDELSLEIQRSLDNHNALVRKERDDLLEQTAKLTKQLAERTEELAQAHAQLRDKGQELRATGAEADEVIERIRREKDVEIEKLKAELLIEQVRRHGAVLTNCTLYQLCCQCSMQYCGDTFACSW